MKNIYDYINGFSPDYKFIAEQSKKTEEKVNSDLIDIEPIVNNIESITENVSEINSEVSELRKQVEILKQELSDERKRAEEAEKKAQNVSHGSAALIAVFSSLIGYSLPIFIEWFKSLLQ